MYDVSFQWVRILSSSYNMKKLFAKKLQSQVQKPKSKREEIEEYITRQSVLPFMKFKWTTSRVTQKKKGLSGKHLGRIIQSDFW